MKLPSVQAQSYEITETTDLLWLQITEGSKISLILCYFMATFCFLCNQDLNEYFCTLLCVTKVLAHNGHTVADWIQLPCWRMFLLCQKPFWLLTKASYSCCWKVFHMLSVETQGMTVDATKDIQKKETEAIYCCCQHRQGDFCKEEISFTRCWRGRVIMRTDCTVLSLISEAVIVVLQYSVGLEWLYQTF